MFFNVSQYIGFIFYSRLKVFYTNRWLKSAYVLELDTLQHFFLLCGLGNSSKFSHISIKFQADSSILASSETGRGNCLPYTLVLGRFPESREDKYRDEK